MDVHLRLGRLQSGQDAQHRSARLNQTDNPEQRSLQSPEELFRHPQKPSPTQTKTLREPNKLPSASYAPEQRTPEEQNCSAKPVFPQPARYFIKDVSLGLATIGS